MTETAMLQHFGKLDPFQNHPPCHVKPALNRKAVLISSRSIPEGSETIEHPQGLGVAYLRPWTNGKFVALGYRGDAGKHSFNFSFKTREYALAYIQEFFSRLTAHKERIASRRAEDAQPHTLKPNDIIHNSWGYDQTNVDWYRVVKTSAHFVWLIPICAHVVEDGFMSGPSEPHLDTTNPDPLKWGFKDNPKCEITQHKARRVGESNYVNFEHGSGSQWDGKPMYCSWYA